MAQWNREPAQELCSTRDFPLNSRVLFLAVPLPLPSDGPEVDLGALWGLCVPQQCLCVRCGTSGRELPSNTALLCRDAPRTNPAKELRGTGKNTTSLDK